MPTRVATIGRYPIKGLSVELLEQVMLSMGECVPHDRRFAIARAGTHVDPQKPEWLPKTSFFMLMRDKKLAQLHTCFDDRSGVLTIERDGQTLLRADITSPTGRNLADAFFAEFLKDHSDGPPRLVEVPGHTFSDAKQKPNSTTYKYLSVVNLDSVGEVERVAQVPVDPIRFRANIYISGAPKWGELNWVGGDIQIGEARLRVVSPITRCAATAVNPSTAERDVDIPGILKKEFGPTYMGVYAEVVAGGKVARGSSLTVL
jgi:hypothetical protein